MQRSCKLVSSLSRSGGRRRAKSSREYHSLGHVNVMKRNTAFLHSYGPPSINRSWVNIWADIKVFSKVSHTRTALHLMMCVCHAICLRYALSCSHSIIPSFPGDFFTAAFQCPGLCPHQVERVRTLGDGGKWVCGLDRVAKQKHCVIYSFGLSLLYPLHAAEMVGRISCMHANPARYII